MLIGGATTSSKTYCNKMHSEYKEPIIRVRDASKVAQIVGALLNKDKRKNLVTKIIESKNG